jgi:transcriptional regulator with XRE-family HTH domain
MRADRLGQRLREAREKREYTQEELRRKLNFGKNLLSNWETGKAIPDGIPALVAICRELEISADWVLGLSEETAPQWVPQWVRERVAALLADIDRGNSAGPAIPPGVGAPPPGIFDAVKRKPKQSGG